MAGSDRCHGHRHCGAGLPALLHLGDAAKALDWYDDFVTIVVHPGEAVARRQMVDEAGVVHEHAQVLLARPWSAAR